MKIHFKLLIDKIDKEGQCPIFIRSKLNGKEFKYFTGEKCNSKDWDTEKSRIKRSDKNYKKNNECLDKIERDIENYLHLCKISNITPSVESIKDELTVKPILEKKTESEHFFLYFEQFLKYLKTKGAKESSIKHYAITINHLKNWGVELSVTNYTDNVHNI